MKKVTFYFDFISPYSYLAVKKLEGFEQAHDVQIDWVPVNLPKLIQYSGNVPPSTIKNKALYSLRDLKRWADYLDVPFKMVRPGSYDSRPALRIAAALRGEDRVVFVTAVFEALWAGEVSTKDEDWLDQIFNIKALPISWRSLNHDVLDENTTIAIQEGAFGVPTFMLRGDSRPQMFFGVDRMGFLARACDEDTAS